MRSADDILAETEAKNDAGNSTGEDHQQPQALFQYDAFPRWIKYSGLPQALGPNRWSVFRTLVEIDHQTLKLESRRHGQNCQTFACPQTDILRATGCSYSTVRRVLQSLLETDLLAHYKPGKGGSWSHFEINIEILRKVFEYVAPRLRPIHGGIWNLNMTTDENRQEGLHIYGRTDSLTVPIICNWARLRVIQKKYDGKPKDPDLETICEICGIDAK